MMKSCSFVVKFNVYLKFREFTCHDLKEKGYTFEDFMNNLRSRMGEETLLCHSNKLNKKNPAEKRMERWLSRRRNRRAQDKEKGGRYNITVNKTRR